MKNIFRFGFLALFMASVSCDDATDIIQEGELDEEAAYRTVDDLQSGLNGVYAAYTPDSGGNGDGDLILFNDLFTDNIKKGDASNNQGNEEYNFIINTNTDFPTRLWGSRYSVINLANRVLRNIDRVIEDASDADIARANHIRGQLIALRALSHFDLLQYFAVDYQAPDSPGVIIMDFVPDLGATFPRNTVGECFTFIKADLEAAAGLLSASASDTFYITRDALAVIRARVLLFEGKTENYPIVEQICDDLLERHSIIDVEDQAGLDTFLAFWADTNLNDAAVTEDIWTLFRGQDDSAVASLYYANETNNTGSAFFEMSNQLFDSYEEDDVRIFSNAWIDESSITTGSDRRLYINKYPGSSRGLLINHVKLFRAPEVLLMQAEAQARQGNYTGAAELVFALRDARRLGTPDAINYNGSLNAALTDILAERRRELCFEGHRYLDLKRIGKELNIGIARDDRDCGSFAAPCDLAPSSNLFTMPIPQSEINANNDIIQNPGY